MPRPRPTVAARHSESASKRLDTRRLRVALERKIQAGGSSALQGGSRSKAVDPAAPGRRAFVGHRAREAAQNREEEARGRILKNQNTMGVASSTSIMRQVEEGSSAERMDEITERFAFFQRWSLGDVKAALDEHGGRRPALRET